MKNNQIVSAEHHARDRLVASLRDMVSGTEHLLKTVQHESGEEYRGARDRIHNQIVQAKSDLCQIEDDVAYRTRRALRTTRRVALAHPLSTAVVFAGVCLLIGMVAWRR